MFGFKRGADRTQTRDFNRVQTWIIVLRCAPQPAAFDVSTEERARMEDSDNPGESELDRIKTQSWWFTQQLVNPSLRAGVHTTSEAASRSSLVIAIVQVRRAAGK